jgi:heterodisulfide reductase subunit C
MVLDPITPDQKIRRSIEEKSSAGMQMCWTCGTCDIECPVYLSTERLLPQKIIRMANLGMLEALLDLPDIWYCQMCRRCHKGCPNAVKPFEIISYVRREAIQRKVVQPDMLRRQQELVYQFQKVRWRTVEVCMTGELGELSPEKWQQWLQEPVRPVATAIAAGSNRSAGPADDHVSNPESLACYTCSECSGCCPIVSHRPVFDPQYIIRMANFGLTDELIRSPSIWLCLKCELCGTACSQKVRGYKVIRDLQALALKSGAVDPEFQERLLRAERVIYPLFLEEVDKLLQMPADDV